MVEKFKVCKLGGTGCKYWSESSMYCTRDSKYKENPELCEMYPSNVIECALEELEQGKREDIKYLKERKRASWNLLNDFAKEYLEEN